MSTHSTWRSVLVVAALTALAPTRAWAQEAPPENSPTDSAAREKSRAAFRRGVAELRAQDWAGARVSFEEAWALFPHPSILLNLGIAHLRTDEPVLAEQDLVRFLSEDPGAAPEEISGAREALAEARSKIGTLRVIATPAAARVTIDSTTIPVRSRGGAEGGIAEARLVTGKHVVRVEADGFGPKTSEVDLPAKSETSVRVSLVRSGDPKPEPPSTLRPHSSMRTILGWSLAGASGVSLAASAFMGGRALSLSSDYGDRSSSSFQSRDVKDEGITFRTGADIALVTALVTGGAAAVLLLTDLGASTPSRSNALFRKGSPRLSAGPSLLRW